MYSSMLSTVNSEPGSLESRSRCVQPFSSVVHSSISAWDMSRSALALIVHEFLRAWGCAFAEKPLRCGMMRVAHNSSDPREGASPRWAVAVLAMWG